MKIYYYISICSFFLFSCKNDNCTQINDVQKDIKQLSSLNILPADDTLSSDGGILFITARDSLSKDSLEYSEFIVAVLTKNFKNRIVYRVLNNNIKASLFEKRLRENPDKPFGNIVLQNIKYIKEGEIIKIPVRSPYFKMPLKTIKATIYIENNNPHSTSSGPSSAR